MSDAWEIRLDAAGATRLGEVRANGQLVGRTAFFAALAREPDLRAALTRALAALPFAALRWETAPIAPNTARQPALFAVIDTPALNRPPDRSPFEAPLRDAAPGPIACWPNLSGDAVLVVPRPSGDADYGHLAAFLRAAPAEAADALWRTVGEAVARRLVGRARPLWVSTSGLGVQWLHVRLDDHPKYYVHGAFRAV